MEKKKRRRENEQMPGARLPVWLGPSTGPDLLSRRWS